MTIIELFDKDAMENMVSTLLCDPDRVVFLGRDYKTMDAAVDRYEWVARRYGKKARFEVHGLEFADLAGIVKVLEKLVQKYEDCTIDLTGGDELFLLAAGMVYRSMPERVQLHRFNRKNNTFSDCDADGCVLTQKMIPLTVEHSIILHGGRIIYEEEMENGSKDWALTPDFCYDVDIMWRICAENTALWNNLITATTEEHPDSLVLHVNVVRYAMQEGKETIPKLFRELEDKKIISHLREDDYQVSFRCKDRQIKDCLLVAGRVLELKTALLLDDTGLFHDFRVGVCMDWDHRLDDREVKNEVDIMGMYGITPVFISCKNGSTVNVEELYKLNTVAAHFGGKLAGKMLVSSAPLGEDFHRRAEELDIHIIDGVRKISEITFRDTLGEIAEKLNKS